MSVTCKKQSIASFAPERVRGVGAALKEDGVGEGESLQGKVEPA